MALPTIEDCFRVAINYSNSINAMTATNVIHVLAPGKDEDEVFDTLNTYVTTEMWEPCTSALNTVEVVVTKLDGTPDGRVYGPSSLTGEWRQSFGSQEFIPQGCALIKLASGNTGRAGRGRIYLPFITEANSASGTIGSGTVATTTTAWVDFANGMVTVEDVALAVASYTYETASQVLNLACETPIATQRRRMKR